MKSVVSLISLIAWITGFVLAKGFWSTFFCIIPFWSWYIDISYFLHWKGII